MNYPIIEFAHKIGKNTAEFTVNDLAAYMKWWLKQPPRRDLMEGTAKQKAEYYKDVTAMSQYRKDLEMGKNSGKNKAAMSSRLSEDLSDIMNMDQEEVVAEVEETSEIVCSMELTRIDVDALLFVIDKICTDYEMEGHEYQASLESLKEGLAGV